MKLIVLGAKTIRKYLQENLSIVHVTLLWFHKEGSQNLYLKKQIVLILTSYNDQCFNDLVL